MAFQDRAYYRDSNRPGGGNPLMWLLTGSVSLGSWFGINVRLHASMIIVAVWVLFFQPFGGPYTSVTFCLTLFASVLLHEFGHCFGSWSVGGSPTEIMMTPLGGLALADAPRRPWATFWTVLCGPMVNLLLCAASAGTIYFMTRVPADIPWNPLKIFLPAAGGIVFYAHWVFLINWGLFTFNVFWPVFPLDGGQLLQSLLWVKMGYYRSMNIACTVGIGGAVVMCVMGLGFLSLFLMFLGVSCLMTCISMRAQIKAAGPWAFDEESDDYSAASWSDGYAASTSTHAPTRRSKRVSRRALKKAQRVARQADIEQAKIDQILAKVSASGMHSLTWRERRTLHKATERQRMAESSSSSTHGRKHGW